MITWINGTHQTISWVDVIGTIRLELSTTSGSDWVYIAEHINSIGDYYTPDTYDWIVSGADSSACLIRIINEADESEETRTNDVFTIRTLSGSNSFLGGMDMIISGNITDINGNVIATNAQILSVAQDGKNVNIVYFESSTGTLKVLTRYIGAQSTGYSRPYVDLTTSGATIV